MVWFKRIVKGILFVAVGLVVFGFIVMLLWNALVPELFKGPVISFWQAAGLLLLAHILLRGGPPCGRHHGWRRRLWRKRWEKKLAAMPPEERERLKAEWAKHCGWHHGWDEWDKPEEDRDQPETK